MLPASIRFGLRSLRRTPGVTLAAVLTLALGIGLATAVHTVADALLRRPLPVADQERLVVLQGASPDGRFASWPLSLDDARAFAERSRALAAVTGHAYWGAAPKPMREGDAVVRIRRAVVRGDYFAVLGARPAVGRLLEPADDVDGAEPVGVLSHAAWRARFGGEAAVVGRRLAMHDDGVTVTVVGVAPPGLDLPRGTELWTPVATSVPAAVAGLHLVGRLAPGATPEAARAELTAFFGRPEAPAPLRALQGVVETLPRVVLGDTRPALLAFAAAAGLLLLVTCINVANLLLVRGLARVREVAVRSALGGARRAIVAQLLVENLLLAVAGGVLGLLVAAVAVRAFVALAPAELPRLAEIGVSGGALAGAVGITAVATLLFALAPAVLTSRTELQQVLRADARQGQRRGARRASEVLVAGQLALALVVLAAAGLVGRSLLRLERAELALDPAPLLVAELAVAADRYPDAAAQRAMLERLAPALAALPGVAAVAPVVAVPFSGTQGWDGRPAREEQSAEEAATNPMLNMELVTPDYFATLGLPVLRGRAVTAADRADAAPVVVLSEGAARAHWPGEDALGKRLRLGPTQTFTVVGIVPDARWRDLREARPSIYFPLAQSAFPFAPGALAIRATVPPATLVPALRRAIAEAAPGVALAHAAPFDDFLARPLAQPRLNALLLAVFAAAALALAAIGLFGVMAASVRQRRRELGVRLALGATPADLRRLVLRRALAITAAGAAVGLVGALAATRLLAALLHDVAPTDPPTLALVVATLLAVGALAAWLPARATGRVEAMEVLRGE